MRPQWIEPPLHHDKPARDLLLLVDLSGSMDTKDFTDPAGAKVDRLTAVKQVLDEFLARRKGDRVGVVVFGNAAFTLVPFTTDLELAAAWCSEMQVGMAGPRTAFGDAIGLGIKLFAAVDRAGPDDDRADRRQRHRERACRRPRRRGWRATTSIVIHTVAIGDPAAAGEDKLDEAALQGRRPA